MPTSPASSEIVYRIDLGRTPHRRSDGEPLVLAEANTYFGLNRPASNLWTRLTAGATHRDLTEQLAALPSCPSPEVAAADVDCFLDMLRAQGLLREEY